MGIFLARVRSKWGFRTLNIVEVPAGYEISDLRKNPPISWLAGPVSAALNSCNLTSSNLI
jgi:hypothetical protein